MQDTYTLGSCFIEHNQTIWYVDTCHIIMLVETFESYVDVTFSGLRSVKPYIITLREEDETLGSSIRSLLSVLCFRVLGRSSLLLQGFEAAPLTLEFLFASLALLARSLSPRFVSRIVLLMHSNQVMICPLFLQLFTCSIWLTGDLGGLPATFWGFGFKGFRAILKN